MAKPNLGGKRKRSDASGGKNSGPVVFAGLTKSEIESSVMVFNGKVKINVPLSGTEDDITDATKERKSISKTLVNYTMSRTSDGNTISDQHLDAYLADNKSDIADFCISSAKQACFGNKSLESQKLNQQIKTQNDVVNRLNRLNSIFSNHTSAKSWIGKDNSYYLSQMKDYIDGKISKLNW